MMTRLLDTDTRCQGAQCSFKKSCARYTQRLTGRVQTARACTGTGDRTTHEAFIEERK